MRRTPTQYPVMRIALRLVLAAMLLVLPGAWAADHALPVDPSSPSADAGYGTGDGWLDGRLADIDRYAARHPDAFAAELERYTGISRDYLRGLMTQPGWRAGDAWFACFLARALKTTCRSVVRARARAGTQAPWSRAAAAFDVGPDDLAQVRLAMADSYRRWARPLQPDAALVRALQARDVQAVSEAGVSLAPDFQQRPKEP